MTYQDEYNDYQDEYFDDEDIRPPERSIVGQALDWGISGSILAILALTVIYTLSPVDAVPDLIPIAGQADDLAAVLAGSGSVGFLAVMRAILRTRVGRWGCLFFIALSAISAFVVFWALMNLFGALL